MSTFVIILACIGGVALVSGLGWFIAKLQDLFMRVDWLETVYRMHFKNDRIEMLDAVKKEEALERVLTACRNRLDALEERMSRLEDDGR